MVEIWKFDQFSFSHHHSMNYQSLHFEQSMSRRLPLWGFLVKLGLSFKNGPLYIFDQETWRENPGQYFSFGLDKKKKKSLWISQLNTRSRTKRLPSRKSLLFLAWDENKFDVNLTKAGFILDEDFKLQCPTLQPDGKCHGDKYFRGNNIFLPWLGNEQQAIVSQFNV